MSNGSSPGCVLCGPHEFLGLARADGSGLEAREGGGLVGFFSRLFDTADFPPRWHCGTWDQFLGWLHIGADVAIFIAYAAIPTSLLYFILRRKDVPLKGIFWLFAAFILSCGLTHLCDAGMFYAPAYRFLGLMKIITAVVSLTTVVALVRVIPAALHLPGLLKVQEAQLAERKTFETQIAELNKQLFERNSQLAVQQKRIESAMEAARIGMFCWNAKTGAIEWELGLRRAMRGHDGRLPTVMQWSDILDTSDLATLLGASMESAREDKQLSVDISLSPTVARDQRLRVSGGLQRGSPPESPLIIGSARVLDGKAQSRGVRPYS